MYPTQYYHTPAATPQSRDTLTERTPHTDENYFYYSIAYQPNILTALAYIVTSGIANYRQADVPKPCPQYRSDSDNGMCLSPGVSRGGEQFVDVVESCEATLTTAQTNSSSRQETLARNLADDIKEKCC